MSVYFLSVGLDEADKLASSIGALIGVAGLGVTACGLVMGRSDGTRSDSAELARDLAEGGVGSTIDGARVMTVHMEAEVNDHGRVFQSARDQHIEER
ncbi:hypothetical protein ACFYP7_31350 [Micromonospora arida]|uniref:hypothetical protein n=1 Tax=Micromonospora arida TaxID=2203715 RepID=UPI0036AD3D79